MADNDQQVKQTAVVLTEEALAELRSEQNYAGAVLGGLIGALVGAAIWAVITVSTHYQIGWMAIGVGFLVAVLVRYFGKGIDRVFGIIGALFGDVRFHAGQLLFYRLFCQYRIQCRFF
jgi:hypothetical protein